MVWRYFVLDISFVADKRAIVRYRVYVITTARVLLERGLPPHHGFFWFVLTNAWRVWSRPAGGFRRLMWCSGRATLHLPPDVCRHHRQ
jgi:hypothetical protein